MAEHDRQPPSLKSRLSSGINIKMGDDGVKRMQEGRENRGERPASLRKCGENRPLESSPGDTSPAEIRGLLITHHHSSVFARIDRSDLKWSITCQAATGGGGGFGRGTAFCNLCGPKHGDDDVTGKGRGSEVRSHMMRGILTDAGEWMQSEAKMVLKMGFGSTLPWETRFRRPRFRIMCII